MMKFVSLSPLSTLAIWLLIPVSAAPSNVLELRAAPPSAAAQTAINYISNASHSAAINPVCIYNGQTAVIKVVKKKQYTSTKTAEAALAAFKGPPRNCHSIAEIMAKAGVQTSAFNANDWKLVSKALAQHASGKTYILLGKDVRSNSVFITDEKPALKANPNVNLDVWEIESDGSVVKTSKTKATL